MKTVKVCIGSACHLKGSYEIINILKKAIERDGNSDKVNVKASFCLGTVSYTHLRCKRPCL